MLEKNTKYTKWLKPLQRIPIYRPVKDMFSLYSDKRVARTAAQLSYFLTLSIFPMLIVLSSVLSNLDFNLESIFKLLGGIVPVGTIQIILDYFTHISENYSRAMLVGGIILFATSSAAAFRSIMGIMNDIQGKRRFTAIWGTIVSFLFSLVFVISIYLSVGIILTGGWFMNMLNEHFHIGIFAEIWKWMRFVVLLVLLFGIIYGLYRVAAPREKPRPQRVLGALLASIALVIVSVIFSWFIGMSARYSLVYGSLASIIILMIWLNWCGNILVVGNIINVVVNKYRKPRESRKKQKKNKD